MKRSENWRPVVGYEGFYEVSDFGNVMNSKTLKTLNPINNKGYRRVCLYKDGNNKYKRIHRLVLEAFVGPSDEEINHLDGNKANNCLSNLVYSNRSDNMKHAFLIGLHSLKGCKNNRAKFNVEEIAEVKKLINQGIQNKIIAEKFNCCRTLISHIKRGYTYAEE